MVGLERASALARDGKRVLLCVQGQAPPRDDPHGVRVSTAPVEVGRILREARPELRQISTDEIHQSLKPLPEFGSEFLRAEWDGVLSPGRIRSWDDYRDVMRTGMDRGLTVIERHRLWEVFEPVVTALDRDRLEDLPGMCRLARDLLADGRMRSPYDAVVVDGAQEFSAPELAFLTALGGLERVAELQPVAAVEPQITEEPAPADLPESVPEHPVALLGASNELLAAIKHFGISTSSELLHKLREGILSRRYKLRAEARELLLKLSEGRLEEDPREVVPALPPSAVPGAFVAFLPETLKELCSELSHPETWRILAGRMGLSGSVLTLQQLGDEIKISRERVRQIEAKALRALGGFFTMQVNSKKYVLHAHAARDLIFLRSFLDSLQPAIVTPLELRDWCEREWNLDFHEHEPSLRFLLGTLGFEQQDLDPRASDTIPVYTGDPARVPLKKIQKGYLALRARLCDETEEPQRLPELLTLLQEVEVGWSETELYRLLEFCPFVDVLEEGSVQAPLRFLKSRPQQARRLLREAGGPLTIDSMTRVINQAFEGTGANLLQPENLRNQLASHPGFKPLGRSNTWALVEWTHLENRSITELMEEVLRRKRQGMTVAELHAEVAALRPASPTSIQIYLYSEPEFKQVDKNRWGLAEWPETEGALVWSSDQVARFAEEYFKNAGPVVLFQTLRTAFQEASGFNDREARGKLNTCRAVRTFRETEWGPSFATFNPDWRHERRGYSRVKKTLRQRVEEEVVRLLSEAPAHERPLNEIIETLVASQATNAHTLYSYIAACTAVEYVEGPNRSKICRLVE